MKEQTKYRPSMGLAFNEDREMIMLSEMAGKGWRFYSYRNLGYKFKKSEPEDLIYSVDMHAVKKDEKEQYFNLFEDGGWAHVCSAGNSIHFFSASPDTKPIYTDRDTLSEKYKKGTRDVIKGIGVTIIVLVVSFLLNIVFERLWVNKVLSLITSMITGGSIGFLAAMILTGIMLKIKSGKLH